MDVEITIPEPLWSVMQACEVFCLAACCGLDAFDISVDPLREWKHPDKRTLLTQAAHQVEALSGSFTDEAAEFGSTQLNHYASGREWIELLDKWKVVMKEALSSPNITAQQFFAPDAE